MLKNYYQVLGVPEQASEREIKQAHRQQALLLHPDRTPDPQAQARFLEVQEAYDILGDPHRRLAYDLLRQRAHELATAPRGPSRYDPPPAPYRRRGPRAHEIWAAQLRRYVPWARRLNWLVLVFCLSLALDWALPLREFADEYVTAREVVFVSVSRSNPRIAYLITTPNTQFKITEELGGEYPLHAGAPLTVWRTPLWRVVRRIQPRYYTAFQPYAGGIYSALAFWPALLLVVAAVGLWPGRPHELQVNAAVVAGLLLIITLFVLVQSA